MIYQRSFNSRTVIGNLILINVLVFVAKFVLGSTQIAVCEDIVSPTVYRSIASLDFYLALYLPGSVLFAPWQIITHLFMHFDLMHILFNMYALWMFGTALEEYWGPKRFLIYYFVCGIGAAILYTGVRFYELEGADIVARCAANAVPVLGASGAVFGVLLGFGMLFPNTELMILFFPIPIKAKYFVIMYGAIELFSGLSNNPGDDVAHFAHLGGMIFGFILIKYWGKNRY